MKSQLLLTASYVFLLFSTNTISQRHFSISTAEGLKFVVNSTNIANLVNELENVLFIKKRLYLISKKQHCQTSYLLPFK